MDCLTAALGMIKTFDRVAGRTCVVYSIYDQFSIDQSRVNVYDWRRVIYSAGLTEEFV